MKQFNQRSRGKAHLALTAGMVLATLFIFSCSGDDGGGDGGGSSSSDGSLGEVSSSSSGGGEAPGSSSSDGGGNSQSYGYCLFSEGEICLEGPFTLNDCNSIGGKPSNSCPYGGVEPSSSSAPHPSSSSVTLSSSSVTASSSSVVPSSSSETPSSSSEKASSSSVLPSSSSVGLCANFVEGTKRLHYGKEKEQFCDERDGQKYVYVVIGSQTWMAENLNYNASGSKCYEDKNENCVTYSRLYNWATAKASCPKGWYLPSIAEWWVLYNNVGGDETAGTVLKAKNGWNRSGNGTDDYGFSALPGGGGSPDGSFSDADYNGRWWSASEDDYESEEYGILAYNGIITSDSDAFSMLGPKHYLYSVRCMKD